MRRGDGVWLGWIPATKRYPENRTPRDHYLGFDRNPIDTDVERLET